MLASELLDSARAAHPNISDFDCSEVTFVDLHDGRRVVPLAVHERPSEEDEDPIDDELAQRLALRLGHASAFGGIEGQVNNRVA